MTERILSRALLAAMLLFAPQVTLAQIPVPPLNARVTDLTSTLTSEQRAALEQKLAAFEAKKGSQIAVLIVPTTQPEPVEQYAVRVQETWKLGRKGVDDGVLMVVAKNDRKLWIEVGYGLEGVLPDATAKRIIEEEILPRFKQGDFAGGLAAGAERIMRVIDGEPLPPPKSRQQPRSYFGGLENLLIIGFVLVFAVGSVLRAVFGRFLGAGIIGLVIGVIAWTMVGAFAVAIIVAILAFILSLFGGTHMGSGGYYGGGGSSGGGWSSGGGGFSGGGGSSGGGGAGGSW
jgi:uncharacterized protein